MATLAMNRQFIYLAHCLFVLAVGDGIMKIKLSGVSFALVFLGILCGIANADSITLRDGHHVQGKFAGGTQGVIAFSVGGATQYYEVSNILVMTFEGEGNDAEGMPHQQSTPSIIPQSGSSAHQKLNKPANANMKVVQGRKSQQKHPVRLVMTAQRSE